jgi:hypothetical protein
MQKLIKLLLAAALALPLAAVVKQQAQKPATAPVAPAANPAESSSQPGQPAAPKKLSPELTPTEVRQVERFSDLYEEYAQQASEAQTRLKVVQEMQQKLMSDFNNFQAATIAARGYKSGEGVLDLQQRKVSAAPARTDKPSTTPSK